MKKFFTLSALVLFAVAGCTKDVSNIIRENDNDTSELILSPVSSNDNNATRGYVEEGAFEETYCSNLHAAIKPAAEPREMQMSSYLYPQDGEEGNYFVDETFAKGDDNLWHADPAVYWPVGGTLDFLAFSLTTESQYNKAVAVRWDSDNAASKVILSVPAENTQNDILYASAANVEPKRESAAMALEFKHAQAWLEFQLTGSPDGVVTLKGIELENAYNAGTLTISNNGGTALAQWDFAGQKAQNIPVDNIYDVDVLMSGTKYMDMLIPQQPKTAFVLYYTLGTSKKVLSYRFETDQKTWLMGEKYVYNISITSTEITVNPKVLGWSESTDYFPSLPKDAIKAEFTINEAGDKVAFSRGNLQATNIEFDSETRGRRYYPYIWSFAEHQYDFIGDAPGNAQLPDFDINIGETLDLFGWSSENWKIWYSPYDSDEEYYQGNFVDWGGKIDDGNAWRTLTLDEWTYIWNGNDGKEFKYCKATLSFVENPVGTKVKGVILFPDNWVAPAGITISSANIFDAPSSSNVFTKEQFDRLEASGCVFLPCAGIRDGEDIYSWRYNQVYLNASAYWTATPYEENDAFGLILKIYDQDVFGPEGGLRRNIGCSVRLVLDL